MPFECAKQSKAKRYNVCKKTKLVPVASFDLPRSLFSHEHNLVLVLVAGGKLERGVVLGGKLQPHRPDLQPAVQLSRGEELSKSMEDIVFEI